MRSLYLVSSCGANGRIFLVDLDEKKTRPIFAGDSRGIGLCENGAWVACNGDLIQLNSNFKINQKYRIVAEGLQAKIRRNIFLKNLVIGPDSSSALVRKLTRGLEHLLPRLPLRRMSLDLHDVSIYQNVLYVVLSRYNCIAMFQVEQERILQPAGFIYIDTHDDDLRHVNSIYPAPNGLYMTMFSLKGRDINSKKRWSEMLDGGLVLIKWEDIQVQRNHYAKCQKSLNGKPEAIRYEIIYQGIIHPHSIQFFDNWFYVCESADHRICRISSNGKIVERFAHLPGGYIRGLHVDGEKIIVGVSTTKNHSTAKKKWGEAGLWYANQPLGLMDDGYNWEFVPVPAVSEIYDIKKLQNISQTNGQYQFI